MKIFVFAYDRYQTMTTSEMLEAEGIDHVVLCHNEEQKSSFIEGGRVLAKRLVVTNKPKGLSHNRGFALELLENGEWGMFLVDDLVHIAELDCYDEYRHVGRLSITPGETAIWKKRFDKRINLKQFITRCEDDIRVAEKLGVYLIGFSSNENPLFRNRKWIFRGLVDGRAWLVKRSKLLPDLNVHAVEDYCWTARNLMAFGSVMVNNWILVKCERYTAGGYGSKKQRLAQKLKECDYLVSRYGKYIAYANKPGEPARSHIKIKANG